MHVVRMHVLCMLVLYIRFACLCYACVTCFCIATRLIACCGLHHDNWPHALLCLDMHRHTVKQIKACGTA